MIDLRYHIYSLTAVFLALAIGIVIGTSFAKRSPMSAAERGIIARYQSTMRILKDNIEQKSSLAASKEAYAKKCEEFCKAVLPIVVKDRLLGRNIAIVQTGDYDELTGSIKRALELAGAKVTSVTDISRTYNFSDNEKLSAFLIGCGINPSPDGKAANERLMDVIADTLHASKYNHLLTRFQDEGIGKFTGDYFRFNKLVVLVGGAISDEKNTAQLIDVPLIRRLQAYGVTVVGCENEQAGSSYVPVWKKTSIATVDNSDTAMGQAALVCALNGEVASFGIKETADRWIPQTLEKK